MSQPQCFQSLCFLLLQIQIPWLSCLLLFSDNCKQPRKAAQCPASLLLTHLLCQISSSALKLHGHKASKAFKLWWRYLYCTFPCSLIQFHLKPHHNDLYNPCFATTKKNLKDISDFLITYSFLLSPNHHYPYCPTHENLAWRPLCSFICHFSRYLLYQWPMLGENFLSLFLLCIAEVGQLINNRG